MGEDMKGHEEMRSEFPVVLGRRIRMGARQLIAGAIDAKLMSEEAALSALRAWLIDACGVRAQQCGQVPLDVLGPAVDESVEATHAGTAHPFPDAIHGRAAFLRHVDDGAACAVLRRLAHHFFIECSWITYLMTLLPRISRDDHIGARSWYGSAGTVGGAAEAIE